jgi:hypothetical protein
MALGAHIHRMWTFPKLAKWQVVQDILRIINAEYVSPVAREEHRQKQAQKGGKWAYRDRAKVASPLYAPVPFEPPRPAESALPTAVDVKMREIRHDLPRESLNFGRCIQPRPNRSCPPAAAAVARVAR